MGKEIDEFGEPLNDVEQTLNRIGVSLRDGGNWRDFYDVLDEIAGKWDELSELEKSQATTALGGTRQRENILVMLENWDKVKQYAETGADSAGTSMEKYDVYLESITAKQEQLTAQTQSLWSNLLPDELIINLLEVAKALLSILNLGDGLVAKILLATTALIALNAVIKLLALSKIQTGLIAIKDSIKAVIMAIPSLIKGLKDAKTAQDAWNASTKANLYLAIAEVILVAIIAIGTAISANNKKIQESIDKANELTDAYKTAQKEAKNNIKSLTETDSVKSDNTQYKDLQEEFDKLTEGVDEYGRNLSLSNQEYERYKSICERIIGLNPDLMKGYDSEVEAIGNKNDALSRTIELLETQARLEAKKYADSSDDILEGAKNKYQQETKDASDILNVDDWKVGSGVLATLMNNIETAMTNINAQITTEINDAVVSGASDATIKELQSAYLNVQNIVDMQSTSLTNVVKNWNKHKKQLTSVLNSEWADDALKGYIESFINMVEDNKDILNNAKDTLADSMDSVYEAVLNSSETYSNLNTNARQYFNKWVTENFDIDETTTKEIIDANKETIVEILERVATSSYNSGMTMFDTNEPVVGQMLFDKLFEVENSKANLTAIEYGEQITETLRHIYAMIYKVDPTTVTNKQIFDLSTLFGFEWTYDNDMIYTNQKKLDDALKNTTEELRQTIQTKIDNGEYKQKDIEIIISLKPKINGDTTLQQLNALINIEKFESVEYGDVFADYAEDINDLSTAMETFTKAQEEYNANGAITASTMKKIIDEGLLDYIEVVNGKLTFNTEKLKENGNTLKENATQQLQCALFTDLNRIALETYGQTDLNNDGIVDDLDEQMQAFLKVAGSATTATEAVKGYADATGVDTSGWTEKQNQQAEEAFNKYKNMVAKINAITISSSSKTSSSSSKKSAVETAFDNIKKQFEADEITIDEYISNMSSLLTKCKKGTDEYEKIKKELNAQKLDRIEKQFERGEITVDEYIKKLEELRKEYKKNTEGYKELTDTINDTKLDKWAKQFENGEITLKKYLDLLKEIQKQYKKGSEQYNDIASTMTDAYIETMDKGLDEIDNKINQIGDVNTAKETTKYAQLLSEKYKTTQSYIADIRKQLKSSNITAEQKVKLQEQLNKLLEDEVSIRDEMEENVQTYYETQKEYLEQQAEAQKKEILYQKELELYGEKGKELFEWETNKKIQALEDEIDLREKERDALDKVNEREELTNSLLEARLKLQNALNNKTTKILKKQADGTWQYEYSANMKDIQEAEKAVQDAEKALDDYDFEQNIQSLKDEADKLSDNMEYLANQYDNAEFFANREYERTINSIADTFGDIDKLVQDWIQKYGDNNEAYQKLVNSNSNLTTALKELTIAIDSQWETVGTYGELSISTGQTSSFNALLQQLSLSSLIQSADVTKFGSLSNKNMPVLRVGENSTATTISKVECVFPNITTTDGLQKAILDLPMLALQKK